MWPTLLYGAAILMVLYLFVYHYYSVYYTPGVRSLYDTPVSQMLFPQVKGKMMPDWGYDELGMIKSDLTKYGRDRFWPQSGKGYEPTASASGGASPSGGERNAVLPDTWELRPGYSALPVLTDVYDAKDEIPERTVTQVGWWGKPFNL
jgi:hypothetical protein